MKYKKGDRVVNTPKGTGTVMFVGAGINDICVGYDNWQGGHDGAAHIYKGIPLSKNHWWEFPEALKLAQQNVDDYSLTF